MKRPTIVLASVLALSFGCAPPAAKPAPKPEPAPAPVAAVPLQPAWVEPPQGGTELEKADHLKDVLKTVRTKDLGTMHSRGAGRVGLTAVAWTLEGSGRKVVKGINLAAFDGKKNKAGIENSAVRPIDQSELAVLAAALDRMAEATGQGGKDFQWCGLETRSGVQLGYQGGSVTLKVDTVVLGDLTAASLKELKGLVQAGDDWLNQLP
jgi:hypothetical protein